MKDLCKMVFISIIVFSFLSCGTAQNLILKGDAFLANEQVPKAIKSYQAALKKMSNNESALKGLADCYYKEGDWENAIVYYEKLIVLFPWNQEYLCNCGFAYFFLGFEHQNEMSFFTNEYKQRNLYPYKSEKVWGQRNRKEVEWISDWKMSNIYYDDRNAAEYAYKSKTINGGRKGKLYTNYENSFNYLSKAISIAPTWKSYLGMGLIYSVFSPLNFDGVGGGGNEHIWDIGIREDKSKAKDFFFKSIESVPNWQAHYAYAKQCFFSEMVNKEIFSKQERKQILDFFEEGLKLSFSDNAPDYVIQQLYYYRGYFYEEFEKNYTLALRDLEKAKNLEDKIRGGDLSPRFTTDIRSHLNSVTKKISDEKIAQEKGYKSLDDYYADLQRQEEIEKQKELARKRVDRKSVV